MHLKPFPPQEYRKKTTFPNLPKAGFFYSPLSIPENNGIIICINSFDMAVFIMSDNIFELNVKLPVEDEYDVIVAGGGTAGCFAAICAARSGAKTLLIEKNGVLGGTVTAACVDFPGLFFAWGRQIISGPCWEAVKRAEKLGGAYIPEMIREPAQHWQLQIKVDKFIFETVLDELCQEAQVDVLFHSMISFAHESEDGVYLAVTGKEGLKAVFGKAVVDATGDADLTRILGYECVRSERLQPATLMNYIGGYDKDKIDEMLVNMYAEEAFAHGEITKADFQGGNPYAALKKGKIDMHINCPDAASSKDKTALEIEARRSLLRAVSFFKKIPGLEHLYVSYAAEECGVRETYRIVGEKTITAEEYLSGKVYDDAVCYCFYPIDLHYDTGIKQIFLEPETVPTIPYGALIPKNSKRIIAAGRCVSGDTDSNSAYRVQAPCMAMGQAGGVAAAICAKENIKINDVNYDLLCEKLSALGAIVPQKADIN